MKNKIITIIFILSITLAGAASVIISDNDISFSERRPLFSFYKLTDTDDFSSDFEKYSLDHFVLRNWFREIKAFSEYNIFKKTDNNGLFEYNDYIIKQLYPLDENSVNNLAEKINKIVDLYISDNNVYYSVIPDKNYFTDNDKYLKIDYEKMTSILRAGIINDVKYIDLYNSLTLNDYYKTDHHFRIDGLSGVLSSLGSGMDINLDINGRNYTLNEFFPFYGAYYGQAAMNIDADTLLYIENDLLKNCSVKIWETFDTFSELAGVYDYDELGSVDSYNMFLYGTKPVVTIENPHSKNEREIIIFKDSFTNSLAPLLVESYSKITLVDLRLVNHTVLDYFVNFDNADILFLYSTLVVNNSSILK